MTDPAGIPALVGICAAALSALLVATTACGDAGNPATAAFNPEAGPFCALDSGLVPALSAPDPCVEQCIAPHSYCQGPLAGGGGWGCCVNPPLPDGAPNSSNDCLTAACGRQ